MNGLIVSEKTSALVEKAYAAALDDSLWPEWAHDIVAAVNGVGASLVVLGSSAQPVERMIGIGWSDKLTEEYHDHWWQHDPQVVKVASLNRSIIYRSNDYIDEREPVIGEYCRWQRARSGFDHHIGILAMLGSDGSKGGISVHRNVDAGPVSKDCERDLTTMLPDIVRAFRLGFQHQTMLATSFWDGLMIGSTHEAMLLIDERGAVIRATNRAVAIMAGDDGLRVAANRVHADTPADDAAMFAMIGRSIAKDSPVSGAMRVCRRSGKRHYIVVAYPLVRQRRMRAPLEAAALLRIIDPSQKGTGSQTLLREAFDLTPREAELAVLLVAEHSVESAAAMMNIAIPTARIHLRRLLSKTGTSRQAELMRLLSLTSRVQS